MNLLPILLSIKSLFKILKIVKELEFICIFCSTICEGKIIWDIHILGGWGKGMGFRGHEL